MNKKFILSLSFIMLSFLIKAQIKIADQPDNSYYELFKEQCIGKLPKQAELLAMKPGAVPTTLMDTLKKYDWADLGGYGYHDKEYTDYFANDLFKEGAYQYFQFNFFRILADGVKAEFSLKKFKTDHSYVTTTSFTKASCQIYEKLKIYKFNTFLQTSSYGEIAYSRIVSYKNGVLIVDITKTGKLTDTKVMYRLAYKAIPRKFTWDFQP